MPVVFAELAGQGRIAGGHLPQGDPFVGGRNRHPPVGHRRAVVQEASVRAGGDQQRPAVARQRGQCPLFAGGRLQAAHRHPPAQFQPASEAGRCVAADEGGFATQRFGEDPGDGPRLPRVAAADRQGLRIAGQRGGVTRGLRQQGRWQRRRITQPDLYAGPAGGQVGQCEGHRRRGAQGGFGQRTAFAFEQQQAAVACRAGDQGRQVMFGGATVEAGGEGHDEARGRAGAAGRALQPGHDPAGHYVEFDAGGEGQGQGFGAVQAESGDQAVEAQVGRRRGVAPALPGQGRLAGPAQQPGLPVVEPQGLGAAFAAAGSQQREDQAREGQGEVLPGGVHGPLCGR